MLSISLKLEFRPSTSPYEGINWSTFGQYRATLHTHTFNSDGVNDSDGMNLKINALLALDYDMVSGASYMVTRVAFREGVNFTMAQSPIGSRPRITNISVNRRADTITISAENAHTIRWITSTPDPMQPTGGVEIYYTLTPEGTTTVTSTINLAALAGDVGSFVRANIIGPTGLAATQPFGTARR